LPIKASLRTAVFNIKFAQTTSSGLRTDGFP
jgi:hypothetical protein